MTILHLLCIFVHLIYDALVATSLSCIVYVPVDVIKERLQVQNEDGMGRLRYRGSLHALRTILAEEGVRGIYKVSLSCPKQ